MAFTNEVNMECIVLSNQDEEGSQCTDFELELYPETWKRWGARRAARARAARENLGVPRGCYQVQNQYPGPSSGAEDGPGPRYDSGPGTGHVFGREPGSLQGLKMLSSYII